MRPCPCGGRAKFKRVIQRTVLSSIGPIGIHRRYYACEACGAKSTPLDPWAGLGRRSLSESARRMVTLAGSSWSFDVAAKRLKELCHVQVSDDTIERVCQEEGQRAQRWMQQSPEPLKAWSAVPGRAEFYSDGLKINTVDGWREMRLSVFAKRQPTRGCEPADWNQHVLNEPTVRMAECVIGNANRVGAGWKRWGRRLGLSDPAVDLDVLGDGARWIWNQAAKRLNRCRTHWCLDVLHGSQHLHDCGKAMFGEGAAARQWADQRRDHLLAHNGVGLIGRLQEERAAQSDAKSQAALDGLLGYFHDNRDAMWYRQRLAAGLPIGSGLIEGACKNTLHARLRINSARWRIRRVERIGSLRCLDYSGQWDTFWSERAA